MKLTTTSGKDKSIVIRKFGAMEGWDIQRRFVEFAMSKDTSERVSYTMKILSFAAVEIKGADPIPLITDAMIENHLEDWRGIQAVFDEVLKQNGINPATHAEKEHYWAHAGAEMASSFIAEATRIFGPLLELQKNRTE